MGLRDFKATPLLWGPGTSMAITDTSAHNSDPIGLAGPNRLTMHIISTLNQTVTVTFQGSGNGTDWFDLPNPRTVLASTQDGWTLSDTWKSLRAKAQCGVAPGSGNLQIIAQARYVEA